jgi:hypothetical protein
MTTTTREKAADVLIQALTVDQPDSLPASRLYNVRAEDVAAINCSPQFRYADA